MPVVIYDSDGRRNIAAEMRMKVEKAKPDASREQATETYDALIQRIDAASREGFCDLIVPLDGTYNSVALNTARIWLARRGFKCSYVGGGWFGKSTHMEIKW